MPNPVQTVTIAQALASSASGLLVADTGANIANALPNGSLTARVSSFSLTGAATLSAAQTLKLAQLGGLFHRAGNSLTLSDTLADIDAPANAAALALATGVQAADYAYHLLSASPAKLAHVTNVAMIGDTTLSVAQLTQLKALPGFHLAPGAHLTLADSATHIAALLAGHPGWFALVTGMAVHLDGSVMASAQAVQLSNLASEGRALHFVSGGADTTLKIAGSATDLAAQAAALNRLDTLVTPVVTLSPGGGSITAAQAVALEGIVGISLANNGLTVADTGASLTQNANAVFGHGFAQIEVTGGMLSVNAVRLLNPDLHFQGAATAQLNASAIVSVGQASFFAGLPGFSLGGGVALTVAGTPQNLIANPSAWEGVATAVQVGGDATLSASGATILASLATHFGGQFSLGGHSITVSDSLANILGLSGAVTALLAGVSLNAGATVDAAQLLSLSALPNFSANGNSLALLDTAANLLALSQNNLSQVSSVSLAASATLNVAQAEALAAEPSFSTNGHSLTIADTAANLATLPHALQLAATTIALNAPATVSAAQLTQLAALGVKFFTDDHALTVADTAANLESLSPAALGLSSAEVINQSAVVSTPGAASLAALPALSLATGVTLTVQDSVAHLLALGTSGPSCVTTEMLSPGNVTIDAAQAAGLAGLPHFSTAGAIITVADSLANFTLGANAPWSTIASITEIVDSGANLAANASTALVQNAGLVTLSGNATVTAAQAALIATIPEFSAGGSVLHVADTAVDIAAAAGAISQLSADAVVTDGGPVSVQQADLLAEIASAGLLSFEGGVRLIVQGDFADLAGGANQAGLALAARISVVDSAANLVAAAAHDWGSVNPTYTLNQSGVITAAQATALAALGTHYANGGYILTVADTAAGVTAAAAALASLGLSARVADTAGGIDAMAAQLESLGATLTAISVTNPTGLSAATAAGLAGLAGKLTGPVLDVSDNAAAITTYQGALTALGAHVSIAVTDTAAALIGNEPAIAALAASATLAAAATVSASGLATLAQLAEALGAGFSEAGHTLTVSDSLDNIIGLNAQQTSIAGLVVVTGTMSISQAAELEAAGLTTKLSATLSLADTSQNIAADLAGGGVLAALVGSGGETLSVSVTGGTLSLTGTQAASILASPAAGSVMGDLAPDTIVSVTAVTAAAFAGIAAAGWPNPHVAIVDSAADIAAASASLSQALENFAGSLAITLTDFSAASAAVAASLAPFAAYLVGSTELFVSDTASAVAEVAGALESLGSAIGVIFLSGNAVNAATAAELAPLSSHFAGGTELTVTCSAAQATLYAAQLEQLNAASHLAQVVIQGASLSDILTNQAAIAALPARIGVVDSAATLAADLTGGASVLALDSAKITSVTLNSSGLVSAAALADMAALPGFSTAGNQLGVIGTAAAIDGLSSHAMNLAETITIEDSAADIGAAANAILQALSDYAGSTVIELTDTSPVSASVAAGLVPVAGLLTGITSINVSDTAADVVGEAAQLEALGGALGTITLQTTTLSAATDAALVPLIAHLGSGVTVNVADTAADIAANLGGLQDLLNDGRLGSVTVADDSVADVAPHAAALNAVGASVTIRDSAANVQAGLASLALVDGLTAIVLTDSTTPSFTLSLSALPADGVVLGKITLPYHIAILDTAADIEADLLSGASSLIDGNPTINAVTVSDGQTVTLSLAALLDSEIGLSATFTGTLAVTGVDVADIANVASRGGNSLFVVDSAADIAADLTGGASNLLANQGILASVTLAEGGTVSVAALSAMSALPDFSRDGNILHVQDTASAVAGMQGGLLTLVESVGVNDTALDVALRAGALAAFFAAHDACSFVIQLSDSAPVLAATAAGLDPVSAYLAEGTTLAVTDNAAQIAANASSLSALGGALGTVTVTDVTMSAANAAAISAIAGNLAAPLVVVDTAAAVTAFAGGLETLAADDKLSAVQVSGAAVSDVTANLSALDAVHAAVTVIDSSGNVASGIGALAELTGLQSIALNDGGLPTLHLNVATLEDGSAVLGKIISTYVIAIADTASAIQADLEQGAASALATNAHLGFITIDDAGTVTLTQAELLGSAIGDGVTFTGTLAITGVDMADLADVAARGPTSIAVSDLDGPISTDLQSGDSVLAALAAAGKLAGITDTDGGTILLTAAQIEGAGMDDSAHSVAALANGFSLAVTGAHISDLPALENLHSVVPVAISDNAADFVGALNSGSALYTYGGPITSIHLSGTLNLTDAQAQTVLDDEKLDALVTEASQNTTIDVSGVSIADLAEILGAGWANTSLGIVDTASAIAGENLAMLDSAASVTVEDSAAQLGGVAAALADYTGHVFIDLTDTLAVRADTATGLLALSGYHFVGNALVISDTTAHVAAVSADLATLAALGIISTISLSDYSSVTLDAADAAKFASLSDSLAAGTQLSVVDTAAAITANEAGLMTLHNAGELASVSVANALAQDVLDNAAALSAVGAQAGITDSAAHLANDFASLVADRALISSISATGGDTLTLSADEALASGAAALLQKFSGAYAISGAGVGQLSDLATLPNEGMMGANIAVADTASNIIADLRQGSSSQLAAAAGDGEISGIAVNGGTLTMTDTQALDIAENESANWSSVENLFGGTTQLAVTGVAVTDAATVMGLFGGSLAGISLAILDSAHNIADDLAGLDELGALQTGGHLASVSLSSGGIVDAAALTAMASLPNFSTAGQTLDVTDGAPAIAGLSLSALAFASAVTIEDSAATIGSEIGALATALSGYEHSVSIDLTDTQPVSADTAAALWTLAGDSFTGNQLDVSGNTADVVSVSQHLAALADAGDIGTITLSDYSSTTLDAADAAKLAPLAENLAAGTQFVVADSAGAVTTHETALQTLYNAGELASVTVSGASVSDVVENEAALNAVHAAVSVSALASDVQAQVLALSTLNNLQSITLTDPGLPTIDINIADLGSYAGTLGDIVSPFDLDVRDTAAHFQADILAGPGSILAANAGMETSFTVTDGNPVVLTQDEVVAGSAPGDAFALTFGSGNMNATLEITSATLQFAASQEGSHTYPLIWSISDTADHIEADLANIGNGSVLQSLTQNNNTIAAIDVSDGGTVSVTAAVAEASGVDDGPMSLIGLMTGANIAVTDAAVTDLPTLDTLYVQPAAISLSDTATAIAGDLNLGAGASELLANAGKIGTIAVGGNGIISLSAAAALTAGVDDGAASLFAKLTGPITYHVTGAMVSQLAAIASLWTAPTQISVTDDAANIAADVTGAGLLATYSSVINAVTLDAGGTVSEAALTAMAALPNFSTGGQSLIVQDSAASIASIGSNALNLAAAVQVQDSGERIAQNIDALQSALSGYAGTVSIAAAGTVTVTIAQYTGDLTTLHDITGSDVLAVTGTASELATAAAALEADSKVGFAVLSADASVTTGVLATLAGLPHFALGGFNLDITGNTTDVIGAAANIATYATSVTLTDDASSISGNIDALEAALAGFTGVVAINVASGTVSVTAGQYSNDHAVLDCITSAGAVTVTGTAGELAAMANSLAADSVVGATALSANAQVDVSTLNGLAVLPGFSLNGYTLALQDSEADILSISAGELNLASSVSVQDSAAGIGAEAASLAALLAQYTTGATPVITLTDSAPVSASVAASLVPVAGYLSVGTSLAVTDSPAHVLSHAAGLATLGSLLGTLTLTSTAMDAATAAGIEPLDSHLAEGVTLTVTDSASAINANSAALDQLNTDGHLASVVVTGLTVALLTTYQPVIDALPHSLDITDTAAQIAADLTSGDSLILGEGSNVASVTLTQSGIVDAAALTAMTGLPGFSLGGYTLTVEDNAADCLALGHTALGYAYALQVQDTASAIGASIDSLQTAFAATAHFSILVTGGGTVCVSTTQFTNDQPVLDGITTTASVAVTGTAASLAGLQASLNADNHVGATLLSASATVSAATLATLATLAGFSTNSHALTLNDTASGVLGLPGAALDFATDVHVSDNAADVAADLAPLSALTGYAGTLSITLSDASPAISISATQYGADSVAIGAISNAGVVSVSGTAAQVAAIAGALAATNSIGSVSVTDSASDIAANLPALETLANASKLHVTLTDSAISANLVTPLLAISGALTNGVAVVDTASQLAALAESSPQAATYLNTYGATLSASGSLDVADAAALEALTHFSLGGNTLSVWDTAAHLVAASAGVLTNGNISGVYLKTTTGTATLTAATAASLLAIANYSSSNPPGIGGTNTLIVSDTAAHLATYYTTLAAHLSQVTGGVVVNASATITDGVLAELQSLHAIAGTDVSLTVRDTAANIAANAASQAASAYIVPSVWQLSGSATVTEAQAAVLGGLSGFTPGAYTLTLSLSGNTSISLSDANNLGNIASALALGGHLLMVSGTAAQLATLSNPALNLVTPQLTDTFSHILAIGNALMLKGSVTVSDSESISAAQATSFLNMLTTQGGAIHPTSLTFANSASEAITDSIIHLQSLQSSAPWTNNTSLHGAFTLVASDTVANLIAGGSAAYLETLSGSTLSSSQTTDAASAETLALIANEIHFSMGSHILTISDLASNLLSSSNVDGLALAGAVELSASATMDAADAESLLSIDHFVLNQSLTIEDSSANLLDGVLAGDISGLSSYVHVELAGSETLDAQTAASLVSLTGFADPNGYLSIADGSSYLLASANLTAEQIASSVTLAGDETVSANTILRLSEIPHFVVGENNLTLASDDYADAATLQAIGGLGSNFSPGGHSITVTAETLDLTPTEFAALQSDNLSQSGHVVSAISDAGNTLTISGLGVNGDTIKIYDDSGNLLTSTGISAGSFTVTAADPAMTHNFAVTDVSGGVESAPVVVLDANSLVSAVSGAGASFASYGEIQVGAGQYLNIYQSTAPLPSAPALVYNATTHVISLDIPDQSPVALVTLGGSTLPSSLTASEIFIKHHS